MKYSTTMMLRPFLILLVFLLITSQTPSTNSNSPDLQKNQMLMRLIQEGLKVNHFKDINVNDNFSRKAFDLYLKRLDGSKRFLTKADVQQLSSFQTKLDDQIKKGSFSFFDLSYDLIEKRIREAKSYYKEILAKPFDFTKNEQFQLDGDKREFAESKEELKNTWRKVLKYETQRRVVNKLLNRQHRKENSDTAITFQPVDSLRKKARTKVLESQNNYFDRLAKLERKDRLSMYMNAITKTYDPHSNYLPPKDKENFDISMSGQLEGIGATLQQKDGYIEVKRIVPGSASWRQGDLEAGDIILKVAQSDTGRMVDVVDMRLDKAVQLIRGKKGTKVRLRVKKMDGTITTIPIIRDVVVLEETYARSIIINREEHPPIGYINLPKFYADFQDRKNGRNSSEDVKKEVKKLKSNGAQGIILDLRGNGGGSLKDVVKMAGLFFEAGPVVQVKARKGDPYILSDKDSTVQYRKPLVVMVNKFSASASEIFAAAIQDYERGLVVGSSQTYGKGTVQRFVNLDRFVPSKMKHIKPLGSMKLTTQKFYRVNGDATQLKGMKPDIVLPTRFKYVKVGERELDNAMEWSEIEPADYEPWGLQSNIQNIQQESEQRVSSNETFQLIDENARYLDQQRSKTAYSLNLDKYKQFRKEQKKKAQKYKNIKEKIENWSFETLKEDMLEMRQDTNMENRWDAWKNNLQDDVHLYETTAIMKDLIK